MKRASAVFAIAVLALTATVPSALAVSDSEELVRFGSEGTGAGEIGAPAGIVTDRSTGRVLVLDSVNQRIDEFTPWGEFVRAFGWDVAPSPVNEQQEVRFRATAGQFRLSFGGDTTSDLPFDASAEDVEDALNGLSTIGAGGVSVEALKGGANGTTPFVYVIAFNGSSLQGTDVGQIEAEGGTVPLSGGNPSTSLMVRTRANGGPSGTGLEACTEESGCQKGSKGAGIGQFGELTQGSGIAIDPEGNIYVAEAVNYRLQKFTPSGEFLLMAGGEVNKTKAAEGGSSEAERNLCTSASGDLCGVGMKGPGNGQFEFTVAVSETNVAVSPSGEIFVSDGRRIQTFDQDGVFESAVEAPSGEIVRDFASDRVHGGFYVTFRSDKSEVPTKPNVRRLDSAGNEVGHIEVLIPNGIATDPAGNVYVVDETRVNPAEYEERILQFNSNGAQLKPSSCCIPDRLPGKPEGVENRYRLTALGANSVGDLYVGNGWLELGSFIRAFGPPPVSFEAPPPVAPEIEAEFASSVDTHGATLKAEINPHFWNDTTYYVEYGSEDCQSGSCAKAPLPPGQKLTNRFISAPVTSAGIPLSGLQAATTYHYRFVAQSSGGGPAVGPDRTFRTFPEPDEPDAACPNQAFRTGLGAKLPDCRAFEMVSPVDKAGGDIRDLLDFTSFSSALDQSAASGERFTYTSHRPFGGAKSSLVANQYMATRGPAGWATDPISPARTSGSYEFVSGFQNEFKAFSDDLCQAWVVHDADPILAPGAVSGFTNAYRREGCDNDYEAVSTVEPPGLTPFDYYPEPQGASLDGSESIFRARAKLTPEASAGPSQLYLHRAGDEDLHLVCILPNGTPTKENCSAGTAPVGIDQSANGSFNRTATVEHAISDDGSRIYWSESGNGKLLLEPGRIYLRFNPAEPQSAIEGGACTEAEKACTIAVSQSEGEARYWNATPNGGKALFAIEDGLLKGNLYLFDSSDEETPRHLIAKGVTGVAGSSEDLSKVYFVSTQAIAGTTGAKAGKPNLYLYEGGEEPHFALVATLVGGVDVPSAGVRRTTSISPEPVYHAARVTPDGSRLAFISTASLTGYDNTDQLSGKPDSEVYLYDAEAGELRCASCNPSGARPQGREVQAKGAEGILATAAALPMATTHLHQPRALSEDGSKLFFNSYDALLPRDTNGKADVYEWEQPGSGSCTEQSSAFSPANGGCIYLISGGQSPTDSAFADASADARDVFITTGESLLPQDPGLIDLYDARAGGGFPAPPSPPALCEGEACQAPPQAPDDPTPASSALEGAGNVREQPQGRKKKHKRKKHKAHKGRAGQKEAAKSRHRHNTG